MMAPTMTTMMTTAHQLVTTFDTSIRICVGTGSFPPSRAGGTLLKSWSMADAIDVVIVRT